MRRLWLIPFIAAFLALAARAAAPAESASPPPNVVMIISDDQAWTDYGFMGHAAIRTPNLDRLAAEGAVFERGYVTASLCRPSLASMITGLYPHEHKITGNDPPKGVAREALLKHIRSVDTLPKLLGEKGYVSLQTGKWWEGECRCGGFTEGMTHGDPARGGRHGDEGLKIGRETMEPIYDFVRRAKADAKPFFLWYAPFLPHEPHNPPERLLAHYRQEGRPESIARYYAMCEWFDETCGQLMDFLKAEGLAENTLTVYLADNGWIQNPEGRGFAPRSKRSPYEGGIRTPIILHWPAKIPEIRSQALASSIDLAPTILRACGIDPPAAMTGIDLIPLARGAPDTRNAVFGAIFNHDIADIDDPAKSLQFRWMISGWDKLIWPADPNEAAELYDLKADASELGDIAGTNPPRARELKQRINSWWRVGMGSQSQMRSIRELIDEKHPGWPQVEQWIKAASVPVEVLPADSLTAEAALIAAQVTTRSPMGAIVYKTAGLLVDSGWLRILGAGGHARSQRSLPSWNQGRSKDFYLIADDAVGGFFALNGGALGEDKGNVYYFAPDSLGWEPCGFGYSQFLVWALSDKLAQFYGSSRWDGWESEVIQLTGDQAFNFYPFLFAEGPPIKDRARRALPVAEQYGLQIEIQQQLGKK